MKIIQKITAGLLKAGRRTNKYLQQSGGSLALLLIFLNWNVQAVAPLAGSTIGNQATASYDDGSGVRRTTFSNVTTTYVQQIASIVLTASQTKDVAAGGQIIFSHTVNNNGNGTDTFNLGITQTSGFVLNNIQIFADSNSNGVPDNNTPITQTPALASGGTFSFVIVGYAPGSVTAGQTSVITVVARSVFDNTVVNPTANVDTAVVTGGAVINVTKSINDGTGTSPSGPYTYTLTYNNTGNSASSNLTLIDTIPSGMTYVAGSGRWSVAGSTALTDANGGDVAGINYDAVTIAGQLKIVITNVAPGQAGTITFQVNVNSGVPAGFIDNVANYSYFDGNTQQNGLQSNPARFTVVSSAGVTLTGATIASATEGSTVSFTNVLRNTGNAIDTFNLTIGTSSFPAGTAFILLRSDAQTPLADSNGDGIPDTGPVAPNATYNVILKAMLPANSGGASGHDDDAGTYVVHKTATSVNDPSKSASCNDTLSAILGKKVDITASTPYNASALGYGAGPEANPVVTQIGTAGSTIVYTNYINNTGGSSDDYNLSMAVPSGWSVMFMDNSGNTVTGTGSIAASNSVKILAYVTIPANATAGTNELVISAISPVSGASDSMHVRTVISPIRAFTLTPNNAGQIYPGGAITYSHTLRNTGNTPEGGSFSTINLTKVDAAAGWSTVVYLNVSGSGVLAPTDPVISSVTNLLNPNQSVVVIVKVFSPAGANSGAQNVTTITATMVNGSYATAVPSAVNVTDTTTVITSLLTLLKEQGLDTNCSGTITSYTTATANAMPGACLGYRLTARNLGTLTATNVVINDTVPPFTTFITGSLSTPAGATVISDGTTGALSVQVPTLAPNATAEVTFRVKIAQ